MKPAIFFIALISPILAGAAGYPDARITNGPLKAVILLPDAQHGYYRGTIHDAIMGPVEEFRTGDSALGYDQAKPGETFVKIGVGVLRKPAEAEYKFSTNYEIVNGGKWTSHASAGQAHFRHQLTDPSGYAYVYEKTIRLLKDQPRMVIEHRLKNTGKLAIETSVYNHNFFVIDGQPSGPDFAVTFPFAVQAVADVSKTAVVSGNKLTYVRELPAGESVYTELKGYGATAGDYDIRVENTREKVGAHITGDQPLSKLVFWSIRTTLCPEAYVSMKIAPGKTSEWKITYDFY